MKEHIWDIDTNGVKPKERQRAISWMNVGRVLFYMGSLELTEISYTRVAIRAWIQNYIHVKQWNEKGSIDYSIISGGRKWKVLFGHQGKVQELLRTMEY